MTSGVYADYLGMLGATRFLLKILGKKNTTPQQIWVLEEQKKKQKKEKRNSIRKIKENNGINNHNDHDNSCYLLSVFYGAGIIPSML